MNDCNIGWYGGVSYFNFIFVLLGVDVDIPSNGVEVTLANDKLIILESCI